VAEQFAKESQAGFERTHLDGVVSALMVHAVAARVAIHHGDLARGREELVRAQLVRPLASYALPWASVLAQLEMARAYLAIADSAGARSVVSDAERIVRQRPRLGVIPAAVQELRLRLEQSARTRLGHSTLTPAELRVLPFLPTHLTFEEIGDRMYISRHTVKTHSISIYGKLGVSNRSEAVEQAVEIGLLEPYFGHRPIPAPEG
jgi:LuxR family maltose regulon positive regulatory protein